MDIGLISGQTISIKTKFATFVVDESSSSQKTEADAAIFLKEKGGGLNKVSGVRVVIDGPGDYEIGGVKITATKMGNGLSYFIKSGTLDALLANVATLTSMKDKVPQAKVLILNIDSEPDQALISEADPRLLVVYGENEESLKKIGQGKEKVKKISIKQDKLPTDMETVVLG